LPSRLNLSRTAARYQPRFLLYPTCDLQQWDADFELLRVSDFNNNNFRLYSGEYSITIKAAPSYGNTVGYNVDWTFTLKVDNKCATVGLNYAILPPTANPGFQMNGCNANVNNCIIPYKGNYEYIANLL